eukprot:297964_1
MNASLRLVVMALAVITIAAIIKHDFFGRTKDDFGGLFYRESGGPHKDHIIASQDEAVRAPSGPRKDPIFTSHDEAVRASNGPRKDPTFTSHDEAVRAPNGPHKDPIITCGIG